MELIIKDHLLEYLNDSNILSNKQYVFLPGISTVKGPFLGPILFAVCINTLIEVVKYSDLQMIINFLKYFLSLLQYEFDSMYNSPLLFHSKSYFTMHIDSKSNSSIN